MVNTLITSNQPFVVVQMHYGDVYHVAWADDRYDFYNVGASGFPWFAYDGLFDAWPINTYASKLDQRQAVTTDVTIEQWAIETGTDTYDVTARVCVEPGGVGKTMDVFMVQVLDKFPTSEAYYRNCLMQGADSQQIVVASGACETVTNTFTLGPDSTAHPDDVRMISWAQTPAVSSPAEVHQADEMAWPFNAPPPDNTIFDDDFESGDTLMWSSVVP